LQVFDPSQTVTFSGGIGQGVFGSQGLTKGGRGTLALTGANTYTGATSLNTEGGTLLFKDSGTLLSNPSTITVNPGSVLQLDNSGTLSLADRITDQAQINLAGGTLRFVGGSGGSSETIGLIALSGNLTATVESVNNGGTSALSVYGLAAARPAG